jgi:hypothetical protein
MKQPSKEVETSLPLLLAAAMDRNIHELECLLNLFLFLNIINELICHGVAVAANNTDRVEAKGIFVLGEAEACFAEELGCH